MATVGSILINSELPPAYRDPSRVLDKKGLKKLLSDIANNDPDKYQEILGKLGRMGAQFAQRSGGYSLASDLLATPEITKKHRAKLQAKLKSIYDNDDLTPQQKDDMVMDVTMSATEKMREELYEKLTDDEHPAALMIRSGAKGNPIALSAGVGFDGLYEGGNDRPIPFPVLHNYSEGLNPFEYWAGSFGARRGVVDVKLAVSDGGFMSKQLAQVAHRGVISGDDYPADYKLKANLGLPSETDDNDNIGRYLAHDVGGYKRNTLITDSVLKDLQRKKVKDILVRSPMVGGPGDGSLYAKDVGMGERGRLYVSGENPSMTAAQALSEPISQSLLSSKHCLAEGTLVRMADFSEKPIEQIKPGDYVLGITQYRIAKPALVKSVFDNGVQDCNEYIFQVDKTQQTVRAVCTDQHRFYARIARYSKKSNKDYVRNKSLCIGLPCDEYSVLSVDGVSDFVGINEPRALLLGLLLGDGCFVRSVNGVYFSCHDDTLVPQLQAYMYTLGMKITELTDHYGYYRISRLFNSITDRCPQTGQVVSSERNPIRAWLKELRLYGAKSYEKFIPECVSEWDKRSIAALIGGLWVTDGCVCVTKSKNLELSFGSTSEQMVRQVRKLLELRFGIHSSKVYETNSGGKRTFYSIYIRKQKDIAVFYNEIPLYGVKREKLKTFISDASVKMSSNKRIYRLVESKPVGALRVYDIEIDNHTHCYVLANGLITHNSGGVYGGTSKGVLGFKAINNMLQSPKHWEGAEHAQDDGKVTSIKSDELGNQIVTINGQEHIVPHSHSLKVKVGDTVEAGDVLTDGIPNPREMVFHKGIGDGRVAFAKAFGATLREAGINTTKRNVELVTKQLIDHVKITDEHNDYLVDDTVSYSKYESEYEPREGSEKGRPEYFAGQYLEQPVLHYTIGTKLRPSVLANLKKYGINEIAAHKEPPRFTTEFVRAMANVSKSSDVFVRMSGAYQKRSILEGAQRGMYADPFGPSAYSAVVGRTDFTKQKPGQPKPIIQSILPNLPQQQVSMPASSEPEDMSWFERDG